ncbi:hypothetical protein AAIB41_06375 [Brucella sp. BE17]|uniref:hypothetical protein n=1 Tax=Brucella sp. BE17 TaxID=3142977 RepID=UPI0031BAF417
METLLPIILQLVAGVIGGNVAGAAKNVSLGPAGNSVAGGIGGVILGQLLPLLSSGGLDGLLNGTAGDLAGGGIGGIVLTVIAGLIKNSMANKA